MPLREFCELGHLQNCRIRALSICKTCRETRWIRLSTPYDLQFFVEFGFRKVPSILRENLTRNTIRRPYRTLTTHCSQEISCKNGASRYRKSCHLNSDDGFKFRDPENPHSHYFLQINEFHKVNQKNAL